VTSEFTPSTAFRAGSERSRMGALWQNGNETRKDKIDGGFTP
jgi:hypothetical protein